MDFPGMLTLVYRMAILLAPGASNLHCCIAVALWGSGLWLCLFTITGNTYQSKVLSN